MRGFPLLRLALVAVALALLAIPVWSLTRAKPEVAKPAASTDAVPEKKRTYLVSLTASSPATLRVMAANQPTALSEGATNFFEARFVMDANQPEDLAVFAEFADKSSPHALRVRVSVGDTELADTTLWGTGQIEDVVEIRAP